MKEGEGVVSRVLVSREVENNSISEVVGRKEKGCLEETT